MSSNVNISFEDGMLAVRFRHNELDLIKAKNIPDRRWSKRKKAWMCRPSIANIEYLDQAWSGAHWTPDARDARCGVQKKREVRLNTLNQKRGEIDISVLDGTPFAMPPMHHQKEALALGRDRDSFAYLMDQGTGKTKTLIDDAAYNWREDKIDVVLLFTINSVKTNWVIFESMKDHEDDKDALQTHMPPDVPYIKAVWVSQATGRVKKEWEKFEQDITEQVRERNKLVFLAANIESLRVQRAFDFYERVIDAFSGRVMIVIDESTLIGKPGSKQTKAANKLRKKCRMARIMSGTPVIKSPLKAYSQFHFLDEDILGFSSFYAFRNKYAVMGGYEGRQILFFKDLDDLQEKISSSSYRILKEDCLDLPPQVFEKRRVSMSPAQTKAYNEMRESFIVENKEAGRVEATIVLTQLLRLQQITGGYITHEDGKHVVPLIKPESNPKFQEVLNIIEESGDQRVLVWSRFTHEVVDITKLLNSKGFSALPFYGALSDEEKISVRKRFSRPDGPRCIVGNPAAGGLGIDEFKMASVVIYVTNSFDTEKRKQSEDRAHRIGSEMHEQITYYDIVVPNTVDIKVLRTMRENAKISAQVMADQWNEWI